jgi:hypothetical protein
MTTALEQAKLLVPALRTLAQAAVEPLTAQYPPLAALMTQVPPERWQFFFITTGIGVSLLLAPVQVAAADQDQVCDAVGAALAAWHPQGHDALEDFLKFVKDNLAKEMELPAAVGVWLLWNLKQAQPEGEELRLAWPLGLFFLHSLKDWWDTDTAAEEPGVS